MDYRCVATTKAGFLQQLAVAYLPHGYFYYVAGRVPKGKTPEAVDRKLCERYGISLSRWARARRKRAGRASMQYLRFGNFFVLLATEGAHEFFDEERASIRDFRRRDQRLHFGGYSIGCVRPKGKHRWHSSVRIHAKRYRELKAYFLELACHRSEAKLSEEFRRFPFEPYGPVRIQVVAIWKAVNEARKRAGFGAIPLETLRLFRRSVKPFEPWEEAA